MIVSVAGIGLLAYFLTSLTAFAVEGELTRSFRRRRMEKTARSLHEHYIVCGESTVSRHIRQELKTTGRPYVVIGAKECPVPGISDAVFVEGDPTDNETLIKAGVEHARGLFAATGDDNTNLVISLTVKGINHGVRVLAECSDTKNTEKMKQAGADGVVSPGFIGGMRMASEMIRPTVVSFLDVMLRDTGKNLRVEEVALPSSLTGKTRDQLNLSRFPSVLLLAVKSGQDWVYNPPGTHIFKPQDTLVVMATPEARLSLEQDLGS
jgi:voltage-gated potassium channel